MWDAVRRVSAHQAFDVEIERSGIGAVLTLRGDLDIATVGELERAIADHPSRVVIDLRAVDFVDSSGLKLLLQTYSLAQREGWKLELLGPAATAQSVFAVTGADRQLPFIDRAADRNASTRDQAYILAPRGPRTLRIDLDSSPAAAAAARAAVRELVSCDSAAAEELELLALLVSEVVTNAVKHGGAVAQRGIEFNVHTTPRRTRVVVTDGGPGFDRWEERCSPSFGPGGYGIFLLNSEASRWGTLRAPDRFSVWFELDHTPGLRASAELRE
jgi:anti-sigma B factor antagonist